MLKPNTCRAARGLVGLSQIELAKLANVGESTVRNFEAGRSVPVASNLEAIMSVLASRGAVMIADGELSPPAGAGVRLRG
jgi:DNA-binding transcriptional regulator YiaG